MVVIVVVLLAAGGLFFLRSYGRTIAEGVYVAGVNVGGMSRSQAIDAVTDGIGDRYATETLSIQLPDRTLTLDPADTAPTLDVEQAVSIALRYRPEAADAETDQAGSVAGAADAEPDTEDTDAAEAGSDAETPDAKPSAPRANPSGRMDLDVSAAVTYDQTAVRPQLETIAAELDPNAVASTMEVDEEAETLTITVGHPGYTLDVDDCLQAIAYQYGLCDFSMDYDYLTKDADPIGLDDLYQEICTPAVDAHYDEDAREIVEAVPGYGFDLEAVHQQIAMAKPGDVLVITMGELEPKVTYEQVRDQMFGTVLATYSSPHVANSNRTNNLILACNEINGTVLNPGEQFSFNDIVGERTASRGFKAASVYVSGNTESELGGGVCQVASTLYMCCLLSDLQVDERTEHMFAVTYVPMGMDATIYWGSLDFKFTNSTPSPLLVDANVKDGYVNITFYGTPDPEQTWDHIEMTYNVTATIPWSDVEKVDETKPSDYKAVTQSPYTGYKVSITTHYMDADGKEISSKAPKYPNSSYRKRDRVTTVGPEEKPPEEPTPTTPETPATTPETPTPEPTPTPDPTPELQEPAPDEPSQGASVLDTE